MSFPPDNTSGVTTDNVEYPMAVYLLMGLTCFVFTVISRMHYWRTLRNLRVNEAYVPIKIKEAQAELDKLVDSGGFSSIYWRVIGNTVFWTVLFMGWKIALFIWTWTEFASKINIVRVPADWFAFWCSSATLLKSVFDDGILIADVVWKLGVLADKDAKDEAHTTLDAITRRYAIGGVATSKNYSTDTYLPYNYMGANGVTYGRLKLLVLWVNALFWTGTPLFCCSLIFYSQYLDVPYPNIFQVWFTLFAGVLVYLERSHTYVMTLHTLTPVFNAKDLKLMPPTGTVFTKEEIYEDPTQEGRPKTYLELSKEYGRQLRIGISHEMFGFASLFKGMITVHWMHPIHIAARAFTMFAAAMGAFNEQKQALEYFFICQMIPIVICFYANDAKYYTTYENEMTMYFVLYSYFMQSVMQYANTQQSINFQLLTLQPSYSVHGHAVLTTYGTSVLFICFFGFSLAFLSFCYTLFLDEPIRLKKKSD